MTKKKWELEDFIEQNQRRVYYQMARLQIDEWEGDYFQEGLVAMWRAYENYNPDKGPLTTYMNFQIRNRLVDVLRQSIVERKYFEQLGIQFKSETQSGNYMDGNILPFEREGKSNPLAIMAQTNESDFLKLTEVLTEKQKIWFNHAIVEGLSNQEIAEKEEVSLEAVKSWAKSAKRKLRNMDWERQ
ncbi:RNA polymerase sigma factor [Oceanobacillus sojae]|uniref:RNA polymerase sigma factor n=1 Tax=Oceanobacillus sojae TaxID=582851 RepID=UPI0021A8957F|nr:sigma-70 family RNA polymerase sigma factor [Oceanobacillus sojae]MCT1901843.1 sigma-70 family RNA polymerase sigma factor [Oceanobacillus sojae]